MEKHNSVLKQASIIGLSILGFLLVVPSIFAANNGNNITICHATNANNNPYVVNTPNADGNVSGHDGHDGPIWPQTNAHGDWGDIIPPFSYNDNNQTLQYPGKNWDATGQAIWNNGCVAPVAVNPTSTPTPTPTPTTGGGGQNNPTSTPTSTPTPTLTATATPTPTDTPTPTPTSSGSSTGGQSNSGSSTSGSGSNNSSNDSDGAVLGASKLAATGATEDLMTFFLGLGIVLLVASATRYARETA